MLRILVRYLIAEVLNACEACQWRYTAAIGCDLMMNCSRRSFPGVAWKVHLLSMLGCIVSKGLNLCRAAQPSFCEGVVVYEGDCLGGSISSRQSGTHLGVDSISAPCCSTVADWVVANWQSEICLLQSVDSRKRSGSTG
jgi:hypothetical protein